MVEGNILTNRQLRALELHKQGYNCCQSVILAFPEVSGGDKSQLIAALSVGLGGGVGGRGEICGAASAMALVAGLKSWSCPSDKKLVYADTKMLTDKFLESNGSLICRDLKAKGKIRPCSELICDAVKIVSDYLGVS